MQTIKISKMSGKLANIPAINTNTLSNNFCAKMSKCKSNICNKCYSVNMLKTFRQNCVPCFEHNSSILKNDIDFKTPRIKSDIFRFNAHGEIINYQHVFNLMLIVKDNPDTTFALWTKRPILVNLYISKHGKPKNLILVYSNPKTNSKAKCPDNFDKTFNVFTNKKLAKINCGSKSCRQCMLCYTKNRTKVINEFLYRGFGERNGKKWKTK